MDLTVICVLVLVGLVALMGCVIPFIKVDTNYKEDEDDEILLIPEDEEDGEDD